MGPAFGMQHILRTASRIQKTKSSAFYSISDLKVIEGRLLWHTHAASVFPSTIMSPHFFFTLEFILQTHALYSTNLPFSS